ncbi:phospholipase A and acyltransferase 4-like [Platichthys flesus]|uniref:phospholipase A and acyltransferase 4-like n=1 Tax=Platichthys flesus TaxID=8260 RepID=UPI002DBFC301|nr:phospholipase A and acyltransferase 4-like [Platichthys flesus]
MAPTRNAKPGDLIEISRGLYKHWAVYIGDNEVVHFGKGGGNSSGSSNFLSRSPGEVKREKFSKVVGSHSWKVNNLLDEKYHARDPSVIVKEACAMVGRDRKYNVAESNCEHFATNMRYGKPESRQVRKVAIAATVVNTTGTVAAAFGTGAALAAGAPVIVAGLVVAGAVAGFGAVLGINDLTN